MPGTVLYRVAHLHRRAIVVANEKGENGLGGQLAGVRARALHIAYGHLVRLAIWNLRPGWDRAIGTAAKLDAIARATEALGGWPRVARFLDDTSSFGPPFARCTVENEPSDGGGGPDAVSLPLAARGMVFTMRTLNRLVECTRLNEFRGG